MVGISCRNNHVPHPSQSNALFAAKPRNSEGTEYPANYVLHPPTQSEDVVVAGSEG